MILLVEILELTKFHLVMKRLSFRILILKVWKLLPVIVIVLIFFLDCIKFHNNKKMECKAKRKANNDSEFY